jgi:hypothetical protein
MGLYPKNINEYLMLNGIPRGPHSRVFLVDPVYGSDSYSGDRWTKPLKTVTKAEDLCVAGHHDVVVLIGSGTPDEPAATITWDKNFTHLIGLTSPLPGMGQRARIVNTAANDLTTLLTVSAQGCIFKNIKISDEKDAAVAGYNVHVSGHWNYFENCQFTGMVNATGGAPATIAGSYSLRVSGNENAFKDCSIGVDTIIRTAANAELIVSGVRNRFIHCDIRSYSTTAGKFLVKIDPSAGDMRETIFDDCLFLNYTPNWATGITDAFNMVAGATSNVILRGNCMLVGVGTSWADVVTHVYHMLAAPATGGGIGIAVNT